MDHALLEEAAAERERLRALVGRLSDEELSREIGDGWTVSAVLAHIAFWDRRVTTILDHWDKEGPRPYPVDADVVNETLLSQWRAIPPRLAAEDALAAAEATDRRLEALSSASWDAARQARTFQLDRAHHRREHREEIERFFG